MENNNVKKTETVSIVGFILSFILPLIGLILSIIGLSKSKKNGSNAGLAIAGLILSILLLVARIIVVILATIAFMAVRTSDKEGGIFNIADRMCAKVEKCEYSMGNIYNCEYQDGAIHYSVVCKKSQIPDGIIDDEKEDEEVIDLSVIEDLVTRHYTKYYDGLYQSVSSKLVSDEMVEVTLYENEDQTDEGKVYSINKDTLIGKDFYERYVDLNEFAEENI